MWHLETEIGAVWVLGRIETVGGERVAVSAEGRRKRGAKVLVRQRRVVEERIVPGRGRGRVMGYPW